MMDILKRIDQAQQFCKFYADGAYSVETAQWNHHVNPEFIEDIRQYIESLQLKLMHLQTQQAEPTCPECKAAVLYECAACSSNNYPPKPVAREGFNVWWDGDYDDSENRFEKDSAAYWAWAGWQAAQRQWVGLEIEEVQDSYNSDYQAQTRAVEKLLKERNT